MAKPKGRRALGRGLDALLPAKKSTPRPATVSKQVSTCPIEHIAPRRDQPRRSFDAEGLEELASTIREHGVIQPLVVRRLTSEPLRYELIAGERRYQAALRAGLSQVPILEIDVDDRGALEISLIENLQRKDLTSFEEATLGPLKSPSRWIAGGASGSKGLPRGGWSDGDGLLGFGGA